LKSISVYNRESYRRQIEFPCVKRKKMISTNCDRDTFPIMLPPPPPYIIIGERLTLLSRTFTNGVQYRDVRRDTLPLLFISMSYQNIIHRDTQSLLDMLIRQSVTIRGFTTHDTRMIGKMDKSLEASSAHARRCKLLLIPYTIIPPNRDVVFEIESSKVRRGEEGEEER